MVAATFLIAVIAASLLGSGCIVGGGGGGGGDAQQSMKLQIAGSITVLPISEECARVFIVLKSKVVSPYKLSPSFS